MLYVRWRRIKRISEDASSILHSNILSTKLRVSSFLIHMKRIPFPVGIEEWKKTQEKLTATSADRFSFSLVFCLYIKDSLALSSSKKYVNVPDSLIELLTGRYAVQQRDEMLRKSFVLLLLLKSCRCCELPNIHHTTTVRINSLLLCLYTRQRSSIHTPKLLGFLFYNCGSNSKSQKTSFNIEHWSHLSITAEFGYKRAFIARCV